MGFLWQVSVGAGCWGRSAAGNAASWICTTFILLLPCCLFSAGGGDVIVEDLVCTSKRQPWPVNNAVGVFL